MNKKKLLTMVLALVLIGAVGVGATLAYFTDKAETTNVVTMGHVDIELTENDQEPGEGMTFTDVVPNQELVKDPTITVAEDSLDCYVRATITVEGLDGLTAEDGTTYVAKILADGLNIDDTKWFTATDGYYYYNTKMSAGDDVELFTTVTIPEMWGNEVAGKEFKINVTAEAIQADSFEPTVENGMITAWTYSDGTAITAETYEAPADDSVDTPVDTPADAQADTQ